MKKVTRISFLIVLLSGQMFASFADRGIGKKKARIAINIKTPAAFTTSLNFNLHTGLKYTGSIMPASNSSTQNTLITYQKGNSVYIVPFKQRIFVADVRQGFAGTKLIIRVP